MLTHVWTQRRYASTQFTCFVSTKVQILTAVCVSVLTHVWTQRRYTSTHFTCFASTKVQILTQICVYLDPERVDVVAVLRECVCVFVRVVRRERRRASWRVRALLVYAALSY